ncbi:MAG TPA: hypothetical protein VKT80_07180 [Chloroflexota bacterium]|nr:hypothetical protein [Chloroflexota bacterium]
MSAESEAEAGAYLTESQRLYRELGDVQGSAYDEYLLGRLNCLHQHYDLAREHYWAGLPLFKDWMWLEMVVRSLNGLARVAAGLATPRERSASPPRAPNSALEPVSSFRRSSRQS